MNVIIKPILTEKMSAQGEKLNSYGFIVGRTNRYKKAIVTLKNDDKIDFYSNI